MRRRSPRTTVRLTSAIAATALGVIGLTACSSDDGGGASSDDVSSDEPCGTSEATTVTVGLFGTFGFKENGLYDAVQEGLPQHHHQGRRRHACPPTTGPG